MALAQALVGVRGIPSCVPWLLPVLQGALQTAPFSSASHPRPLPAAGPCPRQLFHGEIGSVAAAGKCVRLPVLSNKLAPAETPEVAFCPQSARLCPQAEAEAAPVRHLRHGVCPNPAFVPVSLPLHQETEPKQETPKLLIKFDKLLKRLCINPSCQLLCKKCLVSPQFISPQFHPQAGKAPNACSQCSGCDAELICRAANTWGSDCGNLLLQAPEQTRKTKQPSGKEVHL